jgi:hypothetical protein
MCETDVESLPKNSCSKVSALYELWSVFTVSRMIIDELMNAGYRIISNNTFYEIEKDYCNCSVYE